MFDNTMKYDKQFAERDASRFTSKRHSIEYREVLKLLNPKESDKILEIGCNSGKFVKILLQHCSNVVGVDISGHAIKVSGLPNLSIMSAEKLEFENESFDKIVCMHTIEHIPDIKKAVREMGRVTKRGGKIILVYPFEPIRGLSIIHIACLVYKNPLMCRQLHLHKLNLGKMKELIKNTCLKVASHKMVFNPWPVYFTVLKKVGSYSKLSK